ncbi:MAG: hypothetical protein ICV87_00040, partial [Gemmatimonadetes bacterium]|nr:hypothetical protein [Gemmatimonadota bacterium]
FDEEAPWAPLASGGMQALWDEADRHLGPAAEQLRAAGRDAEARFGVTPVGDPCGAPHNPPNTE